jgi:Alpha/beta hydrolase family
MSEVEVSGLRIGYERAGTGAPIVLLHGGSGFDGRSWRRQINALSDEYTVVAWDAPGCGRSSDPRPTFLLADYADCLAGFIRALCMSRPHVLGMSRSAGARGSCGRDQRQTVLLSQAPARRLPMRTSKMTTADDQPAITLRDNLRHPWTTRREP